MAHRVFFAGLAGLLGICGVLAPVNTGLAQAAGLPDCVVNVAADLPACISSVGSGDSITIRIAADVSFTNLAVAAGASVTITSDEAVPYELTRTSTTGFGFTVNSSASLTLTNITVTGSTVAGTATAGSLVYVNGGTLTVGAGATLQGNTVTGGAAATGVGGAVRAASGATVNITDGAVITGNSASYNGGGIYLTSNSILNMTGSSVAGNTAANGGGIYTNSAASFSITDSTIVDNRASAIGGGIYSATNGTATDLRTLTIANSTIGTNEQPNTAGTTGGGIQVSNYTDLVVTDSSVQANTAGTNGGGIYVGTYSSLSLTGSSVQANTAGTSGGGVYVGTNSSGVTLDSTTVAGNFSAQAVNGAGGGVHVGSGTVDSPAVVTLRNGSQITDNSTGYKADGTATGFTGSGGGIYAVNYVLISLQDTAQVNGNVSKTNGGGIYVGTNAVITFATAATISGNTAGSDGGGVMIRSGTVSLEGTTEVSGNTAAGDGGGVWVAYSNLGSLDVGPDVVFSDNSASRSSEVIAPVDQPTYDTHVLAPASAWTAGFTQGYNNFDISYLAPAATVIFQDDADHDYTQLDEQTVLQGETVTDPGSTFPSHPGEHIVGWQQVIQVCEADDPDTVDVDESLNCHEVVDDDFFDFTTPVTEDMILRAVWGKVGPPHLDPAGPAVVAPDQAGQSITLDNPLTTDTDNGVTPVSCTIDPDPVPGATVNVDENGLVSFTATEPGVYEFDVTCTDSSFQVTNTVTDKVTVVGPPHLDPADDQTVLPGAPVTFDNDLKVDPNLTYDQCTVGVTPPLPGATADKPGITVDEHGVVSVTAPDAPGVYEISVTCTDSHQQVSNTVTNKLTVAEPPTRSQPGISVVKQPFLVEPADGNGLGDVGENVFFTIEVENTGNVTFYWVWVNDSMADLTLDCGQGVVNGQITLSPSNKIICTTSHHTITAEDVTNGLTNTALVTGQTSNVKPSSSGNNAGGNVLGSNTVEVPMNNAPETPGTPETPTVQTGGQTVGYIPLWPGLAVAAGLLAVGGWRLLRRRQAEAVSN